MQTPKPRVTTARKARINTGHSGRTSRAHAIRQRLFLVVSTTPRTPIPTADVQRGQPTRSRSSPRCVERSRTTRQLPIGLSGSPLRAGDVRQGSKRARGSSISNSATSPVAERDNEFSQQRSVASQDLRQEKGEYSSSSNAVLMASKARAAAAGSLSIRNSCRRFKSSIASSVRRTRYWLTTFGWSFGLEQAGRVSVFRGDVTRHVAAGASRLRCACKTALNELLLCLAILDGASHRIVNERGK